MILIEPLKVFYIAAMRGLMPARKRGVFGTPESPIYYESGDTVPWWVECRWPLNATVVFRCDVETYYEDGYQVVRPLHESEICIGMGAKGWRHFLLVGAPTFIDINPRPKRRGPRVVPKLALAS